VQGNIIRRARLKMKRVAIHVWEGIRPSFHVAVGSRRLRIRATPGTGWLLSWTPDWKTELIDGLLSRRPGLFVDIGANMGQTLFDYCASRHGQGYVGFEPSSRCVDHLRQIIADNRLDDCTIVPTALADQARPLTFHVVDETDPGATLLKEVEPLKQRRQMIVPAYRFDDVVDDLTGGREVSLIKVDVEGAEHMVIEGMAATLRQRRPLIVCEVLNCDVNADMDAHERRNQRLIDALEAAAYKVARINKSSDGRHVTGLTEVSGFPSIIYTRENAPDCDYLFVPGDVSFAELVSFKPPGGPAAR
jgi:FkbM family methyltransferase